MLRREDDRRMIHWRKTLEKKQDGGKWTAVRYEGTVGLMTDAVQIQGPTPHNRRWRVSTILRWKDTITQDCDTLEEAQKTGETLVSDWLNKSGLTVKTADQG